MSLESAFITFWLVTLVVFFVVVFSVLRSLGPTLRSAYRELTSWEKRAGGGGLLVMVMAAVLEHQGSKEYLLTAIGLQLLQAIGGALFVAGALMLLKRIHDRAQPESDS